MRGRSFRFRSGVAIHSLHSVFHARICRRFSDHGLRQILKSGVLQFLFRISPLADVPHAGDENRPGGMAGFTGSG